MAYRRLAPTGMTSCLSQIVLGCVNLYASDKLVDCPLRTHDLSDSERGSKATKK